MTRPLSVFERHLFAAALLPAARLNQRSSTLMPKPRSSSALLSLKPAQQEIDDAKAVLARCSDKEKRSKTGSFTAWCKAQGIGGQDAWKSRQKDRQRYPELFQVYLARKKAGKKQRRPSPP